MLFYGISPFLRYFLPYVGHNGHKPYSQILILPLIIINIIPVFTFPFPNSIWHYWISETQQKKWGVPYNSVISSIIRLQGCGQHLVPYAWIIGHHGSLYVYFGATYSFHHSICRRYIGRHFGIPHL